MTPSAGAGFLARLGAVARDLLLDWGGGLVWLSTDPTEAAALAVRAGLAGLGGHATLMRGPDPLRARVDVFRAAFAGARAVDAGHEGELRSRGDFQRRSNVPWDLRLGEPTRSPSPLSREG